MLGRTYGLLPQLQPTSEPFALIFPPHGLAVMAIGMLVAMIPFSEVVRRLSDVRDSLKLDTARWAGGVVLFIAALASILASGSSTFLYFRF